MKRSALPNHRIVDLHLSMQISRFVSIALVVLALDSSIAAAQKAPRACKQGPAISVDTVLNGREKRKTPLVKQIKSSFPVYPVELRERGIQGEVLVNLVIDTLGMVPLAGVSITKETEKAFGDAVCASIVKARFEPYITDGTKRTVEVQGMLFGFTLRR